MNSLRIQLIVFLKDYDGWIHGGELENRKFPHKNGGFHKPSSVSRCARDLVKDGRLEPDYNSKGHVLYKYNHSPQELFHLKMQKE